MAKPPTIHENHPDNIPTMLVPPWGYGFTDEYFRQFTDGLDDSLLAMRALADANEGILDSMRRVGIRPE